MSSTALALVVAAAFIHAAWNLLAKGAAHVGPLFVLATSAIGAVAYAPWVIWEIARGGFAWSWPILAAILASAALHLVYSLCLQRGYQVADFSVVYPVARGSGPLMSSLAAFALLGETPTAQGLAGLLAVVAGIVLISTQGDVSSLKKPSALIGVRWGLATGAFIASYSVVDAYAVKALALAPVVLDIFGAGVRAATLAPLALRDPSAARARMKGAWPRAFGVALLSPLSYIFVLLALESGAALSVVAPAREMSMMVGALLGLLILREKVGPWRFVGCAVMIAGVVLLQKA
jgi:drug/metabolite transporter (DMT)-like permease